MHKLAKNHVEIYSQFLELLNSLISSFKVFDMDRTPYIDKECGGPADTCKQTEKIALRMQ